jgi:alkanesulfonate monooxygenase SsuD/methylene tetrahydromethanopterin reductase-like flavin-dependent oxidoreductase (luciferase family)
MDERTEHPWVSEGRGRLRFGVAVTPVAPEASAAEMLRLARAVEELGLDSLWVPDHPPFAPDCWTTLAAFAAVTRRVRLGSLVACVFYRSYLALARGAADVDRLSGGRLILGIGTGSVEPEFPVMGLPVPSKRDRRVALDGAIAEVQRLWRDEPVRLVIATTPWTVAGSALNWPPVQRPRVPLLIAGDGEQVTLRRVAQHADMCNLLERNCPTPEHVTHKLEVLRRHCDEVGRDNEAIVRSHTINPLVMAPDAARLQAKVESQPEWIRAYVAARARTPDQVIAYYRAMARAGIQYVVPFLSRWDDIETVELLATKVMPALQDRAA